MLLPPRPPPPTPPPASPPAAWNWGGSCSPGDVRRGEKRASGDVPREGAARPATCSGREPRVRQPAWVATWEVPNWPARPRADLRGWGHGVWRLWWYTPWATRCCALFPFSSCHDTARRQAVRRVVAISGLRCGLKLAEDFPNWFDFEGCCSLRPSRFDCILIDVLLSQARRKQPMDDGRTVVSAPACKLADGSGGEMQRTAAVARCSGQRWRRHRATCRCPSLSHGLLPRDQPGHVAAASIPTGAGHLAGMSVLTGRSESNCSCPPVFLSPSHVSGRRY